MKKTAPKVASLALAAALPLPGQALAASGDESPEAEQNRPDRPEASAQDRPAGPPQGIPPGDIVFDDTWITIGVGAGIVPSYSGSDDYIFFPLPLIVGEVAGVGLRPNGPGLRLDLLSPDPSVGPNQDVTFNFGPAFRIRNDRVAQIEDEVVEQLEDLDLAVEVGIAGGVTIPKVLGPNDSITFNTQVSWDIAGAHEGMLIEPSIGYIAPLGRSTLLNLFASVQIVDDDFAEYYYSVTPEQSAVSGLPVFDADGGLNSIGLTMILTQDLDGNPLNGGFSVYGIGGYSRLVGDAEDTPFTSIRGDANQFIGGIGVAYTF